MSEGALFLVAARFLVVSSWLPCEGRNIPLPFRFWDWLSSDELSARRKWRTEMKRFSPSLSLPNFLSSLTLNKSCGRRRTAGTLSVGPGAIVCWNTFARLCAVVEGERLPCSLVDRGELARFWDGNRTGLGEISPWGTGNWLTEPSDLSWLGWEFLGVGVSGS